MPRIALATVLLTVFAAQAAAEELVNAQFTQVNDQLGQRWDVQPQGSIGDGQNDCFDTGLQLLVNGSQFSPNRSQQTADGSEYVLTRQNMMPNLDVTRRVRLDLARGLARYLEVFTNKGNAPIALQVQIKSRLGSNAQSVAIAPKRRPAGAFKRGDIGVATHGNSSRPDVLFLVSDGRSEPLPALGPDNREIDVNFQIKLKPKETAVLLHMIAQRPNGSAAPGDLEAAFKPMFDRNRVIDPMVPQELRSKLVNFRLAPPGPQLSDVAAALRAWRSASDIPFNNQTRLYHAEDQHITGKITIPKGTVVKTPWGPTPVDRSPLLLLGGAGARMQHRLFLDNGEILSGELVLDQPLNMERSGFSFNIDPAGLHMISWPMSEKPGQLPDGLSVLVGIQHRHRFAGSDLKGSVRLVGAFGSVDIDVDALWGMTSYPEPVPQRLVMLTDGSLLLGLASPNQLTLASNRFGEMSVPLADITSIARVVNGELPRGIDPSTIGVTPDVAMLKKLVKSRKSGQVMLAGGSRFGAVATGDQPLVIRQGSIVNEIQPGDIVSLIGNPDTNALDVVTKAGMTIKGTPITVEMTWKTILGEQVIPIRTIMGYHAGPEPQVIAGEPIDENAEPEDAAVEETAEDKAEETTTEANVPSSSVLRLPTVISRPAPVPSQPSTSNTP